MRLRVILSAALWAALLFCGASPAGARTHGHRIGLILHDGVSLRSRPSTSAPSLATLVQQTQVAVLKSDKHWTHVLLWGAVKGWVPKREIVFRRPWSSVSTYRAPEVHYHLQAHAPSPLQVTGHTTAAVGVRARPGGSVQATIDPGTPVRIAAWQQDAHGEIWYEIGGRWAAGDNIRFEWSGLGGSASQRLQRVVAGKGMWVTLGPITGSSPDAILQAATRNGIRHLYLEAAISPLGFHGRNSVGPLIDAAHRRHIAVIAWVYPYLQDIASDVALTREVARFRTPAGFGFDGIAADLEQNVSLHTVRAYSQLVRAYLGSRYLLVGVTYPPQSMPDYPFAEVAHDYDVLAPMDYWHETKTATGLDYSGLRYGSAYGYRYAADSIQRIRSAAPGAAIAPIGQVFDDFGRLEMGPYAPSAAEITGFLAGSRANGAIGVSFFQWMTATIPEWSAIRSFRY